MFLIEKIEVFASKRSAPICILIKSQDSGAIYFASCQFDAAEKGQTREANTSIFSME